MSEWYIYLNEQQEGPYSLEQIKQMIEEKKIDSNTFVFDNNANNWVCIAQVDELSTLIEKTYFFYKNEVQIGPFTKNQIDEMLKNNELTPDDFIFDIEKNDWCVFKEFSLFKNLSESSSPQTNKQEFLQETTDNTDNTNNNSTKKIQFPCKNHPDKESFLICPECGNDFCEDCLVKVGDRSYCKECYDANKEAIEKLNKPKKQGFFAKLFKKKK